MNQIPREQLPHPTTDGARLQADLDGFGYCLVSQALDDTTLTDVATRLHDQSRAEWQHNIDYENPAHVDPANQWVNMLLNKGRIFQHLVMAEKTNKLIEHLLGPNYLLSACDAQVKHPEADAMPLHSDQWWMPQPMVPGKNFCRPGSIERNRGTWTEVRTANSAINPPVVAVVMWMISEFTHDNGATRLVPSSHLVGHEPDPAVPHNIETVSASGTPGTALVFDGRLWHGAGANRTAHTRYAITCAYCAPQFRTLENYPRAMRPEALAQASPALLKRLGFQSWGIYGHAGDPTAETIVDGTAAVGVMYPNENN